MNAVTQRHRHEASQCLLAEHVSGASAHVPLGDVRLEATPEINGGDGGVGFEQVTHVLDDDIRVVVRLEEPIGVVEVVIVDVLESGAGFRPQIIAAFGDGKSDGRKVGVVYGTHEQEFVAALTPGGLDVPGLAL